MSTGSLTQRNRAYSQNAIRKRLLRSSSQDRQKESAKASTTSTWFRPKLERLLQEGKIEQIMNTDPHTKANLFYTTHINDLEKQLGSTKKSLSTMVMKSKSKEYNINKLKNEIAKIQREQSLLRGDSELNRTKLMQAAQQLSRKKYDLEEKSWVEKCYKNMRMRLAKEEDLLRAESERRSASVGELMKERKALEDQYYKLWQANKKLEGDFHRAKEISKEQTDEKNEFIELLNMEMVEKDMLNDLKVAKQQREISINELAPSVIEKEELQKFLHILFTHKLLSQILKNKSQKLIDQFSNVQNAFLFIRSNTNITEMSKVLERMENQDLEYESLLKRVSLLEKELLGMDSQMKAAIEKQHQILSKGGEEEARKAEYHYKGIHKDNYEILILEKGKVTERNHEEYILKKKIELWVKQHCQLFGLDSKASSEEGFFSQLNALAQAISQKIKDQ